MQAVRLPVKFGIVCAALLVPLCVAIYGVLAYAQENIAFARDERLGVAYVAPLNELLLQRVEPGAIVAPHAVDALEQLATSQGDALEVAETIGKLSAGADATQLIALYTEVSDNSKLTLDPDLDSYYAMAIVMDYAPKLAAAAAQADVARTSILRESLIAAVKRAIAANPGLASDLATAELQRAQGSAISKAALSLSTHAAGALDRLLLKRIEGFESHRN